MNSSNIIVDEKWNIIKPFAIYVPDLENVIDIARPGNVTWNEGDYNFPDFKNYRIDLYEKKWLLNYNDGWTKWTILWGFYDNVIMSCNEIYYGFPMIIGECGNWHTDIMGYQIGKPDIISRERILTVKVRERI